MDDDDDGNDVDDDADDGNDVDDDDGNDVDDGLRAVPKESRWSRRVELF